MTRPLAALVVFTASTLVLAANASAQFLGTFTWQLQPFCNIVTVNLTQQGAIYTLDGFDDQCGAAQRAPFVGVAAPNPDGSIGMGLNVVTVPGGRGVQVDARFTLPTASGTWRDSAGNTGTLAFGAATGGSARPLPSTGNIPGAFSLLSDGGFLAGGALNTGNIPASGPGTRMMWHPQKAAFRAGVVNGLTWDDLNVGRFSAAFGLNTLASGSRSTAFGEETQAIGIKSTAFGFNSVASGENSVAMGQSTIASGADALATGASSSALGADSVAMGQQSVASGVASLAAGAQAQALGAGAIALGFRIAAGGAGSVVLGSDMTAQAAASGTFMFGDRSTVNDVVAAAPNQFLVRAAGGTNFYSNATLTAGVTLAPGGGSWSNLSDARMKEHFSELDGEDVLGRLAKMPVREWNYTSQDAGIRHVGPTAQDFRAAFGLGESDVRINTVDADGVALAAARALEARTAALRRENDELRARLARLEQLLLDKK